MTFVDPWPAHVDHMRQHGLRMTHARDVAEFTVPARALHLTDVQQLTKDKPVDIAFICTKSYDTAWAAMMIGQYLGRRRLSGFAAELHERGNDRRGRGLG